MLQEKEQSAKFLGSVYIHIQKIFFVDCVSTSVLYCHSLGDALTEVRMYTLSMCALFQPGLIVSSRWPATQPVDELVIKSSTYFMEVVHDLRKRLKAFTQSKKVYRSISLSLVFYISFMQRVFLCYFLLDFFFILLFN